MFKMCVSPGVASLAVKWPSEGFDVDDLGILVPSCYAYRDAWNPFVECLNKFWPQRKYHTILATDFCYDEKNWKGDFIVQQNFDYSWCENLKRAVKYLRQYKLFLMLQEDFFLTATPDESFIQEVVKLMLADSSIGCFRLYPCPGADIEIGQARYGLVSKKAPYQVSCQAAIWNPVYLTRLLELGPGPRDFEILGSRYARTSSTVTLAVKRDAKPWPFEYYCTAIVSGAWEKNALDHCKKLGIQVDTSLRPIA
jgi:hypothetical protein